MDSGTQFFKVGILGAAQIAPAAIILPAQHLPSVSVEAVAARDPVRAADFARQYSIPRALDRYAELVADADIDLVYNALPISEHARWSDAALRAGKHVLCEKPLAMNSEQVRGLLEACRPDARLIEAFHSRYHPAYTILREWLDDPAAGAVVSLSAYFNVGIADDGANIRHRPALGGGAMMDLGCYAVMWALFVMGAAPLQVEARAVVTPSGVDESMQAALHFGGDVQAKISCSMAADEAFANGLAIVTEHSRIEFDNPLLPHKGRLTRRMAGAEEVASLARGGTYQYQLERIVQALRDGRALPTEGAALMVQQQTLDRLYAAAGLQHLRFGLC